MSERVTVIGGSASTGLAADVRERLGMPGVEYTCRRFPDGELQVELGQPVRGCDVFLIQSTSPPADAHLFELLLLADCCRRSGAARLTAVVPYFGYARQDRRADRRSLGARVAADVLSTAGFHRVMLIDPHTPALEGFFGVPIDHLSAVPLLARAVLPSIRPHSVVVAPDLGAVTLARAYADLLGLPMAFVLKTRVSGEHVQAQAVVGDVRSKFPLIVDDMLSTGGTLEAAVGALHTAGALDPASVCVTHGLFVGRAREVLRRLPLSHVIASDTVAVEPPAPPHLETISVAPLVATAITRELHESPADLRPPA